MKGVVAMTCIQSSSRPHNWQWTRHIWYNYRLQTSRILHRLGLANARLLRPQLSIRSAARWRRLTWTWPISASGRSFVYLFIYYICCHLLVGHQVLSHTFIWSRGFCSLNKPQLNSIDFVINRFIMKLFQCNDILVIDNCRQSLGVKLPSEVLKDNSIKLIKNLV